MASKAITTASTTLQALYRANLGLLDQKLNLLSVMRTRFGQDGAQLHFITPCPIVKATIGQHLRHSMDHLQLATELAVTMTTTTPEVAKDTGGELHYDLRRRGGTDERDMDEAEARIRRVGQILHDQLLLLAPSHDGTETNNNTTYNGDHHPRRLPVKAYFMLSGDPVEFELPSTGT
jgi:hypothetical protein